MTEVENRIHELFEDLVPPTGKADTVAGEIIRAISRIGYRNYNDGDHVGVGYGRETCNPAARYLWSFNDEGINNAISDLWGVVNDELYDARLAVLEMRVLEYLEEHPELKTKENTKDMWDFRTEDDVDDTDWDDVDDTDWDSAEYWY